MEQEKPHFQHPQAQTTEPTLGGSQQIPTIELQEQIQSLQQANQAPKRINLNTDIIGLFETVSAAPTATPTSPYGQIKIYVNGTTYRLYWYDSVGATWHYVTATA